MQRQRFLEEIQAEFRVHPLCAILGPRQVGKTTLARQFVEQYYQNNETEVRFFDLENPGDAALLDQAFLVLSQLKQKIIVIDEIQRLPELFQVLRVLVDRPGNTQKYLILGSASRDLLRQSSETLAGRIGYLELTPFSVQETQQVDQLWLRGGFPKSYLAATDEDSLRWRQSYITSFLERDIAALGFNVSPQAMQRFWLMLTHYHGQTFNASELGRSLELSDNTVRKYLDILTGTFMVRTLTPWYENIAKRQVKAPKVYMRDSGILHGLLQINDLAALHTSPRLGAFWEGFALEEVLRSLQVRPEECYFWATHAEGELDLLVFKGAKRLGFEFKYGQQLKITRSMHLVQNDLKLDHLMLIYPGKDVVQLADKVTAIGLELLKQPGFLQDQLG